MSIIFLKRILYYSFSYVIIIKQYFPRGSNRHRVGSVKNPNCVVDIDIMVETPGNTIDDETHGQHFLFAACESFLYAGARKEISSFAARAPRGE